MAAREDGALWREAGNGDEDAFAELFRRHGPRVYAFCFRSTGDASFAEDLTAITFLEAWRRRTTQLPEDRVLPWLFAVARNVMRNQRRSLRRYRAALDRLPPPRPEADHADEVALRVAAETQMQDVLAVLRRLPQVEREALTLAGEGLSGAESAFVLGTSEATARTRLFRARRRLRELPPTREQSALLEPVLATKGVVRDEH
jgi:RNA polymerase sigma-70 factor (ECF subfamily)